MKINGLGIWIYLTAHLIIVPQIIRQIGWNPFHHHHVSEGMLCTLKKGSIRGQENLDKVEIVLGVINNQSYMELMKLLRQYK